VTILSERKLGFHSKDNTITLFKKTHTTHDTPSFALSPLAPLATSPATVAHYYRSAAAHRYYLHSSSMLKKKTADQPACGTDHEN